MSPDARKTAGMADQLGDRIRSARERAGLTQAELAAKVGVARETVGNWETGVSSPRNKLAKLHEVLGERLDGNVGGADQDGGVLLNLPAEALEGLDAMQRREVIAAAELAALERAREVRRRIDS